MSNCAKKRLRPVIIFYSAAVQKFKITRALAQRNSKSAVFKWPKNCADSALLHKSSQKPWTYYYIKRSPRHLWAYSENNRFGATIHIFYCTMMKRFNKARWLEFGLVNWTGAKIWDLYFLKALPLGCSKLILGNSLISIPVRQWTKNSFWRLFH